MWNDVLLNWENGIPFTYPQHLDKFQWNTSVLKNGASFHESFQTNNNLPNFQNPTSFQKYIDNSNNKYVLLSKAYNKTFYSFYPNFRWIRFDELKGLSKEEFAERLASSSICLYTDEIAGFGTMPLEAMACGTHVVGWTPLGGKEYMTSDNGFWAANGDIFQLAELLGIAVEKMITGQLDSEEVQKQYEITLSKYTSETEKNSLLKNFNEYKHERIEELQKLKQ
jgi:glycosyltransferase involved in cell wall biosynthesis